MILLIAALVFLGLLAFIAYLVYGSESECPKCGHGDFNQTWIAEYKVKGRCRFCGLWVDREEFGYHSCP